MPRKTPSPAFHCPAPCWGFNEAAARCRGKHPLELPDLAAQVASMRPRPDAAENAAPGDRGRAVRDASMRPRPDAAENTRCGRKHFRGTGASMRPRPDAAENGRRERRRSRPPPRFNEAAARCRGKHGHARDARRGHHGGFNEAAARCRGKPLRESTARGTPGRCFNEAAARCRGKLRVGRRVADLRRGASMRPRPDAAENPRSSCSAA